MSWFIIRQADNRVLHVESEQAVVFHFPNRRLTVATGMLGAFVYLGWYVLGFNSLIYTALLHTLGAKLYKGLGYEMRVWRFGIKYG